MYTDHQCGGVGNGFTVQVQPPPLPPANTPLPSKIDRTDDFSFRENANVTPYQKNTAMLNLVGLAGLLPDVGTMLCLHIADQRSWYLLLLTTSCAGISLRVYHSAQLSPLDSAYVSSTPPLVFPSCGTLNPVKYCQSVSGPFARLVADPWFFNNSPRDTGFGGEPLGIAWSLTMLALLWVDQVCHYFEWTERFLRSNGARSFSRGADDLDTNSPSTVKPECRGSETVCLVCLSLTILCAEIFYFWRALWYINALVSLQIGGRGG